MPTTQTLWAVLDPTTSLPVTKLGTTTLYETKQKAAEANPGLCPCKLRPFTIMPTREYRKLTQK